MVAQPKKVFRIESQIRSADIPSADPAEHRHAQLMAELAEIKRGLAPAAQISDKLLDQYKADLMQAMKLKAELTQIYEAIAETKREIVSLHATSVGGHELHRMADELDAIVAGTETATEVILQSAEAIDCAANDLSASLQGNETLGNLASDIQENVIRVFEACNFQDLTGQRITKVVGAFRFIETRVDAMLEIWGGIESFRDVSPVERADRAGDKALLNGPALETDEGTASQDDIDALFD